MKLFLFIICLSAHSVLAAQDLNAYEKHYFNAPLLNMPYRYMRPLHAEPLKKYPLLIFLHGANQRGFDNERPLLIGGAFFSRDSIRNKYNSYILFPQCPEIDTWAYFETTSDPQTGKVTALNFPFKKQPTEVSQVLMQLLDSLVKIRCYRSRQNLYCRAFSRRYGCTGFDRKISRSVCGWSFHVRCW